MGLTLELRPEIEDQLNRTAARTGVPTEVVAAEAIERHLRSAPDADSFQLTDSAIIEAISIGKPTAFWRRYHALQERRETGSITADENAELIRMSQELEQADADRLSLLLILAERRGIGLRELMHELGLLRTNG